MTRRILVIDDDPKALRLLETQLKLRGYEVMTENSARGGLIALADNPPDVVLLDLALPDQDGIDLCRSTREWSAVPIIMVTCRDTVESKLAGLSAGADDYVTKPFHMGELAARIEAVARRSAGTATTTTELSFDDLDINLTSHQVFRKGQEVKLTRLQYRLLTVLATNADRVMTHERLLDEVWEGGYSDVGAVHVLVHHLRKRLEEDPANPRYLHAVAGVGYRFGSQE